MEQTTHRERIPTRDRRLGRHINHDPRSRRFPYRTEPRPLVSIQHQRHIPIFDQGTLGSCVANAANGCRGTGPFHATLRSDTKFPLTAAGTLDLYRAVTHADPFDGAWEPDDTGSDGLTAAKVLTAAGDIAGYEHTFNLDQALQALMDRPLICGTYWHDPMFNPTPEGLVRPTGPIAGGHEYVVDGYDAERGWVWATNSWGTGWALAGRFAMQAEDWADLLTRDGDVTVFTPTTLPPPVPLPDADHVFAEALHPWIAARHSGSNAGAAKAAKAWLAAKGL